MVDKLNKKETKSEKLLDFILLFLFTLLIELENNKCDMIIQHFKNIEPQILNKWPKICEYTLYNEKQNLLSTAFQNAFFDSTTYTTDEKWRNETSW